MLIATAGTPNRNRLPTGLFEVDSSLADDALDLDLDLDRRHHRLGATDWTSFFTVVAMVLVLRTRAFLLFARLEIKNMVSLFVLRIFPICSTKDTRG